LIKDRGQTDHVTALLRPYALDVDLWPWPMILTFNPRRAMIMTPPPHTHIITSSKVSRFIR